MGILLRIEPIKYVLLVLVIGERGRKFMSKPTKVNYADEPIGQIKMMNDFLPSPDQLVRKEENAKVALTLTKAG